MTRVAPAKINLALHVTGRRQDGYHLLDSIAVFAETGDRVRVAEASELTIAVSGLFAAHAPGDRTDLAWRAAEALYSHCGLAPAVDIRVEKNIPAGAGLGGGSSDAAAVLLALRDFHQVKLSSGALAAIGARLGADVPMCLARRALRARGIGEHIELLPDWPRLPLLLVWPGRSLSTADIFRSLAGKENAALPALPPRNAKLPEIAEWLRECRNDLERPARARAPEIDAALRSLAATADCLLARMSGSGSACFGLYPTAGAADAAAATIQAAHPGWWIEATVAR